MGVRFVSRKLTRAGYGNERTLVRQRSRSKIHPVNFSSTWEEQKVREQERAEGNRHPDPYHPNLGTSSLRCAIARYSAELSAQERSER